MLTRVNGVLLIAKENFKKNKKICMYVQLPLKYFTTAVQMLG